MGPTPTKTPRKESASGKTTGTRSDINYVSPEGSRDLKIGENGPDTHEKEVQENLAVICDWGLFLVSN